MAMGTLKEEDNKEESEAVAPVGEPNIHCNRGHVAEMDSCSSNAVSANIKSANIKWVAASCGMDEAASEVGDLFGSSSCATVTREHEQQLEVLLGSAAGPQGRASQAELALALAPPL